MRRKPTYFIRISDPKILNNGFGIGEIALFHGLSSDDKPDFENKLTKVCENIDRYAHDLALLKDYPSIRFGLETALLDLREGGRRILFPSTWTEGKTHITINGLVWMGDKATMRQRIVDKLDAGFSCIKIKIGGIDFDEELRLLQFIREEAPEITIRLDANGAFSPIDAIEKLNRLSEFNIHSIEQPIKAGQWDLMANLCRRSPIPIALDEELIGINDIESKQKMLDHIRPQFIVLKPTLTGGFEASKEWIGLTEKYSCGWWITSALESNIGLNSIAQWVATLGNQMPQGLGTGQLYENNIDSPLYLRGQNLFYGKNLSWKIPQLIWNQ